MFSRGLGRIRGASVKKDDIPKTPTSLPRLTTLINPAIGRKKALSHRSSAGDLAPPSKPSGLDQALNFIRPRISRPSNAKLKIAPSGAIVFTPMQSQESLGSSLLPAEVSIVQFLDSGITRPQSTPIPDLQLSDIASSLRSSSFESTRSLQSSVPRTTEYERQRRYNFLGRHPPPIQRRSTSLPRILENHSPRQTLPRQALFLGGPTNRPRPGYTKIPRFVPLEIRLNTSITIASSPPCTFCNQNRVPEGCDVAPCTHGDQRLSLDSSRSTRGGSEVPNPRINLPNHKGGLFMSESMGAIKAVGSKCKAVFGKGKENKGIESGKPAS